MVWDSIKNRPLWLRCTIGVLAAVLAAAIRLQFLEVLELRAALLTFYPAVAVAALYGGLGPGLLATVVSAALANYFWMEPVGQFGITNSADLIGMAVFLTSGALMSYLAEAAYRAQARAHKVEEQAKLASEREKAEVLLKRQAELLHLSYDAVIVWQLGGCIESWNKGAEELYGYSQEEAVGRVTHDLLKTIHPEPWPQIEAELRERKFWEGELKHRTREGREVIVSARLQLVRGADGVERVLETNRDITEHKRAEENVARLAAIVESSDDAIIGKTLDGEITTWNRAAEAMYGYTAEEIIGQSISVMAPNDSPDEVPAILQRISRGEEVKQYDALRRRKDGRNIHVSLTVSAIRDASGKIIGASTIARDITERKQMEEELRESQQKNEFLADIIRISSQPFVVGYPDGRLGLVNSAFEHLTGYSSDELQSIDWAIDLTPPEWLPLERQKLEEQILTGKPIRYEKEYIRKDGSRVPIELLVHLVTDSDGRPQYYYSFLTDIAERKRAEEALRLAQSEAERYGAEMATLMDAVPAAVFIAHDVECRHMTGSRFTQELLGLPATANFSKSAPPAERPTHFRAMKDGVDIPPDKLPVQMAAQGREVRDYEFELLFDDGESRHLLGNATPLRNGEGKIYGSVGAFVDITSRKRAEEELHKAKEEAERHARELEALMDAVPALIWITRDTECLSMTGNHAVYEFLGMPLGANVSKTAPETERPVHFRALNNGMEIPRDELPMQKAAKGQGVQDYELEYVFDDGTFKITLGNTTPLHDATGHIYGAIAAFMDITERKQMEEELHKSRDELELRVHKRTVELETFMAKLEQSNQALQDFAHIAAHDMKEPLRKVIAFGNMLRQKSGESLGQSGNDYLNRMINATERMQSLLAGLLDYSRVATASEPFKEVDLSDLIGEVLSDLEVRIVMTGGEVQVGDLPVISADPIQMRQLFQNLIGNALKFHKPGENPMVQVRCVSNTDSGCQIIVEDNGIGFEEQYTERIFAPFQRLHGRSEYEGTGMGLAICKKIVERHGGSITVTSTPGTGTCFIVRLPPIQSMRA